MWLGFLKFLKLNCSLEEYKRPIHRPREKKSENRTLSYKCKMQNGTWLLQPPIFFQKIHLLMLGLETPDIFFAVNLRHFG